MHNGETRGGWRFRLGVMVFVVSFLSPILIPMVAASALCTELKATLSGFLVLGIPEIGVLIAVAIMGKPGYNEMKQRMLAFFKRYGPLGDVSLTRYRIGLFMFVGPMLFASLLPYAEHFIALSDARELWVAAISGSIFVLSFFVLGSNFWDKIRSLFIHGAKVTTGDTAVRSGGYL